MNTILGKWEEFVKNELPADMPENILVTLKHTFYCGAFAFMDLENSVDNNEDISIDASVAIMNGVEDEIVEFLGYEVVITPENAEAAVDHPTGTA